MPPASGYEVLADYLIQLTEEISGLKEQVRLLKDSNVASVREDMIDIKEDLHDIKNIVMLTNNYKPATSTKSQSSYAGAVKKRDNFNSLPHAKNPSDKTSSSHSSGQIIKANPNVPTGS